jgi:hypothetical protein
MCAKQLLDKQDVTELDTRTQTAAVPIDQAVATVE